MDDDDADADAVINPELGAGGTATARWGLKGGCSFCVGGLGGLGGRVAVRLERFEGVRRPNTQETLARMHRWQASAPAGTEHLSFWTRQRSHDMRRERGELLL